MGATEDVIDVPEVAIEDEPVVRRIPIYKGAMYFLPIYDENADYRCGDKVIEGKTVYTAQTDLLNKSTINDIKNGDKRTDYPYDANINPLTDVSKKLWKPTAKVLEETEERKIIKIAFGQLIDGATPFENFKMSLNSKRIYNKNKHEICRDCNAILNFTASVSDVDTDGNKIKRVINKNADVAGEFLLRYLYLKIEIDNPASQLMQIDDPTNFITELMNIVPDDLVTLVSLFVEKYYNGTLNSGISPTNHPYNMDTTFFDEDVKQLCAVKYLGNLLIPMCTHYCNLRPGLEDSIEFFILFYKKLFEKAYVWSGGSVDALKKLHNLSTSMVGSAYKQNITIMNKFEINGRTVESITDEIFSKILITKITAIDIERSNSIAPFLSNIIRRASNEYAPRSSKGYNISIGFSDDVFNSDSDDSVTSLAEKNESKMSRPDELIKIVRKVSAEDNILKVAATHGVTINPDELNYIIHNNIPHTFQTKFTFTLFCDRYSGYGNMYDVNHLTYSTLVLIADNYLRKMGNTIIADYLVAKSDSISLAQRWGGKLSLKRLFEDERYIKLVNEKYKFIKSRLAEDNFVLSDITSLVNSNFIRNKYGDPRNGSIVSHTDDEIISSVLDYYTLI